MKTVASLKLTQEGAMTILRGALDKARALGASASVAVVDDGGHLLAFGRSEEAELYSVAISQAKARSAALTRFPSGKKSPSGTERDDHHAIAITLAAGPGSFVTIPGGFPVMPRLRGMLSKTTSTLSIAGAIKSSDFVERSAV